jgi:3-phosphoshikimate 1-carboxyvinyltransferase
MKYFLIINKYGEKKHSSSNFTGRQHLGRGGAATKSGEDGLLITPEKNRRGAEIDTYNDHRMAMSFALAGLRTANVVIRDPACVGKTYPGFFSDLERVVRGGAG